MNDKFPKLGGDWIYAKGTGKGTIEQKSHEVTMTLVWGQNNDTYILKGQITKDEKSYVIRGRFDKVGHDMGPEGSFEATIVSDDEIRLSTNQHPQWNLNGLVLTR